MSVKGVYRMEPNFERVRRTLFCQEPDRVPLGELVVDNGIKETFLGKPINDLKAEVEFWVESGYDYVALFKFSPFSEIGWNEAEDGRAWANKGIITDMKEFENYPWLTADDIDYSPLDEIGKYLPPGMKVISGEGGFLGWTYLLMGFEHFAISLKTNLKLVERMFNRIGQTIFEINKRILAHKNIGALHIGDDLAYTEGLLISPEILRKYIFPWYKKLAGLAKDYNLPFSFHSDGKLWEVIKDLIDIGINAITPVEPKAMEIKELKEKFRDRLCLIGNVDLGYTLTLGTPEEVKEEVRERIRDIAPGGGYCVSSSNSITNYVPFSNYKAMVEATFKFGKYPINL